jgi:hypothetical protein
MGGRVWNQLAGQRLDKATTIFFIELSKYILYYICLMNNNNVMNEVVKSVGFCADDGCILDDSVGLEEFTEFVFDEDSSSEVSFEEGVKELKDYVERFGTEEDWKEIEEKLMKLKEEVGNEGVWRSWGVEYDSSLAVIL